MSAVGILLWKITSTSEQGFFFVSLCLQVQENIFVEFNHQELLEFYNKVC